MSEFLIIRLNNNPELADWIAVDQAGTVVAGPFSGKLVDAAVTAAGRRVIGLAPSIDVLRTNTQIPPGSRSKVQQILPFALEESVADDIENLHFVSARRASDGNIAVAVVSREKIAGWVSQFAAAGLELSALYADSDAIGEMPATSILLIDDAAEPPCAILKDTHGEVSVIDIPELQTMLDLWLARQHLANEEETQVPVNLQVYCATQSNEDLGVIWDKLRGEIETIDIKVLAGGSLPHLARHIAARPGVNLLQGAFARRSNLAVHWPQWRIAASLLVAFGTLLIGFNYIELREMNRLEAQLDTEIEAAFRYAFPDVKTIREPVRQQMDSLLRARGQSAGNSSGAMPFLDTLQAVATAVSNQPEAHLESLNFRASLMELKLRAPGVETLDKIQQQVSETSGLDAEIQSASASGDFIDGRIRIKPPLR